MNTYEVTDVYDELRNAGYTVKIIGTQGFLVSLNRKLYANEIAVTLATYVGVQVRQYGNSVIVSV